MLALGTAAADAYHEEMQQMMERSHNFNSIKLEYVIDPGGGHYQMGRREETWTLQLLLECTSIPLRLSFELSSIFRRARASEREN
jgi:hypothetical protein